jgi:hypothetical protein
LVKTTKNLFAYLVYGTLLVSILGNVASAQIGHSSQQREEHQSLAGSTPRSIPPITTETNEPFDDTIHLQIAMATNHHLMESRIVEQQQANESEMGLMQQIEEAITKAFGGKGP